MASINERFMDFQIAQQVRWIQLQNREVREALRTLRETETNLKAMLAASDMDEGRFTQARLNALGVQTRNLIKELELKLTPMLSANVVDAMKLSADIEEAAFVRILPAGVDVTTPNLGVLQSAALSSPFNGAPIGEWTKAFHSSLTQTTWNTIVDGITAGTTNAELSRTLFGTSASNFKDGALQARRRGLEALVRTSINHATNQGRQQVWASNTDLLKGVMWVATLDTRTTPICQERDGKVGPVVDSVGWTPPGGRGRLSPPMARPPAHINCRSTTVAITKSWKELGFDVEELPPGTRASMNGQVPANLTYLEWMKRQDSRTQKDVLGTTRWEMWKKDGVNPDKFINDKGRLLTIREVKDLSRTSPLDKVVYQKDGYDFIANPLQHAGTRSLASHEASNEADSKAWEAFRDETVELDRVQAGVKMINISDLKTFQSTVYAPSETFAVTSAPVHVMRLNGQLYLKDGNHRVVDALRKGETRIEARIVDLQVSERKAIKKDIPLPPPKLIPKDTVVPPVLTDFIDDIYRMTPKEISDTLKAKYDVLSTPSLLTRLDPSDFGVVRWPTAKEFDSMRPDGQQALREHVKMAIINQGLGGSPKRYYTLVKKVLARWEVGDPGDMAGLTVNLARKKDAPKPTPIKVAPPPKAPTVTTTTGYTERAKRPEIRWSSAGTSKMTHSAGARAIATENVDYVWKKVLPKWVTQELALEDVHFDVAFNRRAFYSPQKKKTALSLQNHWDIVVHELFHALDFRYRGNRGSLSWASPDTKLNLLANETRAEFMARDNKGSGKYSNGDGKYMLGDWDSDYEGRMYPWDDQVVGSEYLTMAAQYYFRAYGDVTGGPSHEPAFKRTDAEDKLKAMRAHFEKKMPKMLAFLDYIREKK